MTPATLAKRAGRIAWLGFLVVALVCYVGLVTSCAQLPRVGGLTDDQIEYLGQWCSKGCYTSVQGPIIFFIPDEVVQAADDAAKGVQRQ